MDRAWINDTTRSTQEYYEGVRGFINFAFARATENGKILCPCVKCCNLKYRDMFDVFQHLLKNGFLRGYDRWIFHGEPFEDVTSTNEHEEAAMHQDVDELLHDLFPTTGECETTTMEEDDIYQSTEPSNQENLEGSGTDEFFKLLKDAKQPLYPGAKKYTKLSFLVHMLNLKCLNGWSDKSLTMLLELLSDAFPEDNTIPASYYDMKKLMNGLGLGYTKIDVCPNDCMLYWKDKKIEKSCSQCGLSKSKSTVDDPSSSNQSTAKKRKNKSAKTFWWFPLKPRLQRFFMSSKTASLMRWHEEGRTKDGLLRHPADSIAWKDFDRKYPEFASDCRNVRLGLATDGFNPFKTMNIAHSTWPVIFIPYNLPPWVCMKQPSFILSTLIPGPRGPGNRIDVYMQPVIEELNELWHEGVETFDASTGKTFQMRAALMWTIHDFPAYANISGWSTKGQYACPHCGMETAALWLRNSRKYCYWCHRRWLEIDHKFRNDKSSFDGTREYRVAPEPPFGIGSEIGVWAYS